MGDVDGDGLADPLVNAYGSDDGGEDAGKVYLILGASLGSTATIGLAAADYGFIGENAGDAASTFCLRASAFFLATVRAAANRTWPNGCNVFGTSTVHVCTRPAAAGKRHRTP